MVIRIGENPGYVPDPEEELKSTILREQERINYYGDKDPDETDQLIAAYDAQMRDDFVSFTNKYSAITVEAVSDLALVTKIEAWVDLTFWKQDKHAAAKRLEEKIKQNVEKKINDNPQYQLVYYHFLTLARQLLPFNERVDLDSHTGMAKWRTARMLKNLVPERNSVT